MLSPEALSEFKKIWSGEFGSEISDDQAVEEATNLLSVFAAVYRPLSQKWLDEYENADPGAGGDGVVA